MTFGLDHCENCGGVWLDRDDWEALKLRQLDRDLYHVFTDAWQGRVERMERRAVTESHFRRLLGDDAFARAQAFKTWLDEQPNRGQVFAYLQWKVPRN